MKPSVRFGIAVAVVGAGCGGSPRAAVVGDGPLVCPSTEAKTATPDAAKREAATREAVLATRGRLEKVRDACEKARARLAEKRFPETLAGDLGTVRVEIDSAVVGAGLRQASVVDGIELVAGVRQIEERRKALVERWARLEAPIRAALDGAKPVVRHVVLLGMKDPSNHPYALLAPLKDPIVVGSPTALVLPKEIVATDPITQSNVSAPLYEKGSCEKPVAIYVVPRSFDAACPGELPAAILEIAGELARIVREIQGQGADRGLLGRASAIVDPAR